MSGDLFQTNHEECIRYQTELRNRIAELEGLLKFSKEKPHGAIGGEVVTLAPGEVISTVGEMARLRVAERFVEIARRAIAECDLKKPEMGDE